VPDIAVGSLSIAFGNFKRGYTVVDRAGFRLLSDPYTNKPYVRLYCWKRVGGDVNGLPGDQVPEVLVTAVRTGRATARLAVFLSRRWRLAS
jgi:capsid protein